MARKKNKANHTVLFVPNDTEGRYFMGKLREYFNKDHYRVRVHARGPRADKATADGWRSRRTYDQDLPLRHARCFAVYFDNKSESLIDNDQLRRLRNELWELQKQLQSAEVSTEKIDKLAEYFRTEDTRPTRKFRAEIVG